MQNGRAELDVGERVFRVVTRGASTREERLQRLRRELDHGVAVDDPRPAPRELQLARSEHT